jgi:hypothetical protein
MKYVIIASSTAIFSLATAIIGVLSELESAQLGHESSYADTSFPQLGQISADGCADWHPAFIIVVITKMMYKIILAILVPPKYWLGETIITPIYEHFYIFGLEKATRFRVAFNSYLINTR